MREKPFGVIYEIMFPNGKRYIGQTFDVADRIKHYRTHSCKGQRKLYHALCKYGWKNTVFSILFECSSVEEMNLLEIVLIDQYNTRDDSCGYNIREGGRNGKLSKETKEKLRQANLGKKASEETKRKMRETRKGMLRLDCRDNTIRHLKNADGRIFVGIKREFELLYNLRRNSSQALLCGKSKTYRGWYLAQDNPL